MYYVYITWAKEITGDHPFADEDQEQIWESVSYYTGGLRLTGEDGMSTTFYPWHMIECVMVDKLSTDTQDKVMLA